MADNGRVFKGFEGIWDIQSAWRDENGQIKKRLDDGADMSASDRPGKAADQITPEDALKSYLEVSANMPAWAAYDQGLAFHMNTVSRFLRRLAAEKTLAPVAPDLTQD